MNSDYNISNCKNFNSKYDSLDISIVIDSFNTLMSEFLLCTIQNIIVQNDEYLLFVKYTNHSIHRIISTWIS